MSGERVGDMKFWHKIAIGALAVFCASVVLSMVIGHPGPAIVIGLHAVSASIGALSGEWMTADKKPNPKMTPRAASKADREPIYYDPSRWTGRPHQPKVKP